MTSPSQCALVLFRAFLLSHQSAKSPEHRKKNPLYWSLKEMFWGFVLGLLLYGPSYKRYNNVTTQQNSPTITTKVLLLRLNKFQLLASLPLWIIVVHVLSMPLHHQRPGVCVCNKNPNPPMLLSHLRSFQSGSGTELFPYALSVVT